MDKTVINHLMAEAHSYAGLYLGSRKDSASSHDNIFQDCDTCRNVNVAWCHV